jgi:hypothetical protein
LIFERQNAFFTFWGLEITVAIGLLAFVATAPQFTRRDKTSRYLTRGLIAAYVFIDIFHLATMLSILRQRWVLLNYLDSLPLPPKLNFLTHYVSTDGVSLGAKCIVQHGFWANLVDGLQNFAQPCALYLPNETFFIVLHELFDVMVIVIIAVTARRRQP